MATSVQDQVYIAGLTLLQMVSEHLERSSKQLIIFRIINCFVLSFLTVLNFVNYFYIEANMYIKNVESFVVIVHILLKYIVFIYYKPIMENILRVRREKFWKLQNFTENVKLDCSSLVKRTKLVQTCAILAGCSAAFLYILRPCFGNALILEMWIIRETASFTAAILMTQYYTFCIIVPVVIGYDCLYLGLCVDVIVQIRLLKFKLKQLTTMNISDPKDQLINCIKHHQFLLRIFNQMRNIYSTMLIFHYFITLSASCVELYELILGHLEISRILSNFMNMVILIIQFAYYAFPADFVASEFADISKAIYMSKWYNCDVNIQKKLYLMMTRSQYLTYFSAAGIININIETFGGIVRKIVSFYTFLRNLLNT